MHIHDVWHVLFLLHLQSSRAPLMHTPNAYPMVLGRQTCQAAWWTDLPSPLASAITRLRHLDHRPGTTKCIPQSTQTTHCHNQCMPQSPQPLQNKLRACSRCWKKRILLVHSVIKVIKCPSSSLWRWTNASCSFFFRFSFSSSCSFRFRRLACISHGSAGKVSVSESVIVSDGKVSADMDANLKSQTNEGLGSPPDSLSQSSCQQHIFFACEGKVCP